MPPPTLAPTAPTTLAARLKDFLATHKYYGYKDLRDDLFNGDLAALVDAWADNHLPLEVRRACEDTWPYEVVEVYLLRRILQQLKQPGK